MGLRVALSICSGTVAVVTTLAAAVTAPGAVQAPPQATAAQAPATGEESAVKARSHLVVGELVRIDPRRRLMVVKTAERPPREVEIAVEGSTRITDKGRAAALEAIRPGSRLSVTCVDAGGLHVARLVTVRAGTTPAGTTPAALPASPRP